MTFPRLAPMARLSFLAVTAAAFALGCDPPGSNSAMVKEIMADPQGFVARAKAAQAQREAEEVSALQQRGAADLRCDVDKVRSYRVAMYRNALYLADGCGQRASYAPILRYPGPAEVGFVLIGRFPLTAEEAAVPVTPER